jgi:hypothetical protein
VFIQVIRGKAKDPAAIRQQLDHWESELSSGSGWLGTTYGETDDGQSIHVVRFESEEAAKTNGARPDQTKWWEETQRLYDGPVMFYDCPDVLVLGGGGRDDAGFVQLMIYKTSDPQGVKDIAHTFDGLSALRPDIIGSTSAFATDGSVIDTIYFTSEEEARTAERQEWPPEVQQAMETMEQITSDLEYLDLHQPRLSSP